MSNHSKVFTLLLAYLLALNAADYVTTLLIIKNGGYEANWIIVWLSSLVSTNFLEGFFLLKILIIGLGLIFFTYLYSKFPGQRKFILTVLFVIDLYYIYILINNCLVLSYLGVL